MISFNNAMNSLADLLVGYKTGNYHLKDTQAY